MFKKRLIGVLLVKEGKAIQSFGYSGYLPLGKVEILAENLERWGVDEILIICIDKSKKFIGPDLKLMENISAIGLSTPVIYGGGIRHSEDAVRVINSGADRVLIDTMLWDSPRTIELLSRELGNQAVIANFPLIIRNNILYWKNYRTNEERIFNKSILDNLNLNWLSEIMVTDYINEGKLNSFNEEIIKLIPDFQIPKIVFGGISECTQINRLLSINNIVAVGIGNSLNYKEHAVQLIKSKLISIPIRITKFKNND